MRTVFYELAQEQFIGFETTLEIPSQEETAKRRGKLLETRHLFGSTAK
jgi:hypothetical protein